MGMMQRVGQWLGFGTSGNNSPWREDGLLEEITLAGLYGDVSMIPVSVDRALRLDVIDKADKQLIGNLSRLPLTAFDKLNHKHTNQPTILTQPDPSTTLANTLAWLLRELFHHPCAYMHIIERNTYGFPHHAVPVPRQHAETNEHGQLTAIDGKAVNPNDTLRFDSLFGGILTLGSDTIRRAIVLNRVAAMAEENPVPVVELHNEGEDIDPDSIDKLVSRWRTQRQKHGVGYTNKSLKVITHGSSPENLLIDGRKRLDLQLARHANLPAWAADISIDGTSLTYQNRQSKNQELIDQFLAAYSTVIEQRLSLNDVTPRGTTVKFQFDELTKPDMKTRFDTYAQGKKHGFLTNEQISEWEGWETIAPDSPKDSK